ncbi:hypothetical protein [Mycobacterium sp. SMC-17]|uniref:hypothetical protein n=1 Tax=Mycobacterium sp. SMC-17 TaxID=3381628 RepID=UPI003876585C
MAVFNAQRPIRWIGGHGRPQILRGASLFTIQQVGHACGLPGPVIMQLVPRTWVDGAGWMYTADQLRDAVVIAANMRRQRTGEPPLSRSDLGELIACDGCDRIAPFFGEARSGWLHVDDPDSSVQADGEGRDYCPSCHIECPACAAGVATGDCEQCCGLGRCPVAPKVQGIVR